jgi:ketosteroid isomerase-like protein
MSPRAARVRAFWEGLSAEGLARLGDVYAADVHFRDPFNDVRGHEPLRAILAGIFGHLEAPRFLVLEVIEDGEGAVLVWDFDFRRRGEAWRIHGVSVLRFDSDGRVASHVDYWDAASQVYARLPLIGPVIRWLGRRFAG